MASQFCMKCGQPLPPGAQFCTACGTPTPGAGPALASNPPPLDFSAPGPPATSSPPAAGPPLSQVLGVQGGRAFLLQHQLMAARHSYRVLDKEKQHLFTINENVRVEREEMWNNFVHPSAPGTTGAHMQLTWGGNTKPWDEYWTVADRNGAAQGRITLEISRGSSVATLADGNGTPVLVVNVQRGLASITATAAAPDGRPMLEARGNLIHHNFAVHDGMGAEVAKIHEAWATVRDSYNVDLVGPVDPIQAIIFAIIIDHYKGK
jgi:uncharacterized protein YxjI